MDTPTPTASPSPLPFPLPLAQLSPSSFNPHREIWTNLCISTLLDEYEKVFSKLGRGHLRFKDWEAVSHEVNRRTDGSRTPEQCKGKIENLKKHYRRERLKCSISPSRASRWVFYNKLRQVVGDPLPHGETVAVSAADKSCNEGDKLPMTPSENRVKDWDMDAVDKIEFRRKLCEKMGLDKAELQARLTEGFDSGQLRAGAGDKEGSGKGRASHGVDRPTNGQVFKDDVKSATMNPPAAGHKKTSEGAAEAADPSKLHTEKAAKKSSTKNRDLASLGKDLKEGLSNFAAVIEKIERTKMELTVLLQRQRLEQDRHHAEMEVERTRLLMKSQLDLAKLICASSRKDCSDGEDDEKCRKKGRWEVVFDVARCWTKDGEKKAEDMATEGGQTDEHEIRLGNSGDFDTQDRPGSETPSPVLRRDGLQLQRGGQNFRVNGTLTGSQDFRGDGFQSRSQRRNESANGTENCKETESEVDEMRQEEEGIQSAHWDTGMAIVPRRGCDDLNHSINNVHSSVEGSRIKL